MCANESLSPAPFLTTTSIGIRRCRHRTMGLTSIFVDMCGIARKRTCSDNGDASGAPSKNPHRNVMDRARDSKKSEVDLGGIPVLR